MSRNETKIVDHSERKLFFRSRWMCPALTQRIVENEAKELDECVPRFFAKVRKSDGSDIQNTFIELFPVVCLHWCDLIFTKKTVYNFFFH